MTGSFRAANLLLTARSWRSDAAPVPKSLGSLVRCALVPLKARSHRTYSRPNRLASLGLVGRALIRTDSVSPKARSNGAQGASIGLARGSLVWAARDGFPSISPQVRTNRPQAGASRFALPCSSLLSLLEILSGSVKPRSSQTLSRGARSSLRAYIHAAWCPALTTFPTREDPIRDGHGLPASLPDFPLGKLHVSDRPPDIIAVHEAVAYSGSAHTP